MTATRFRSRRRTGSSALLLLALGGATGLVVGAVLADRIGGLEGVRRRGRRLLRGAVAADARVDASADREGWTAELGIPPHGWHDATVADTDDDAPGAFGDGYDGEHDDEFDGECDDGDPWDPVDDDPADLAPAWTSALHPHTTGQHAVITEAEAELEMRVLDVFENDPVLRERAVDISASDDGVITLAGWVRRQNEAAHAVTLARGTPGVTAVRNLITVRGP
jgi:hypothetical protein